MKFCLWFPPSNVYKGMCGNFPGSVDSKKNVKRTGFYMLQKPGALHFVRYLRKVEFSLLRKRHAENFIEK